MRFACALCTFMGSAMRFACVFQSFAFWKRLARERGAWVLKSHSFLRSKKIKRTQCETLIFEAQNLHNSTHATPSKHNEKPSASSSNIRAQIAAKMQKPKFPLCLFPFLFNVLVCLIFSLIKFVLYMQFFHMSFSICNFFEIDINDSHLNHKHYFAYKFVKYRQKIKNDNVTAN